MNGIGYALEGACVRLGATRALDGVDLGIAPGEHVALIGPSGAGKTTLLRVLAAAIGLDAGTAQIDGSTQDERSARDLRALRAGVGFVHQDHALVPVQSVLTNVLAGRLGRGGALRTLLPGRAARRAAYEVLERVGIGDVLYRRVDQLSGGQQQRVAVARALFQEPRVLLADEPVAAVDPERARTVIDLLKSVASERGATLVVSLHDVDLARAAFPRIVALRAGRVAFDARADANGAFPGLDGGALPALFAREEPLA